MDFSLSDDHKMVREMAYNFTRREVMPIIKEHDRNHTFPRELLPKMADLGFLGICLPAQYGGAGMDYISLGIIRRLLHPGDHCRASGATRSTHLPMGNPSPKR